MRLSETRSGVCGVVRVACVLAVGLVALLSQTAPAGGADDTGGKAVAAKFIEIRGGVQINSPGQASRAPGPGDYVYAGEDLVVRKGGRATLAMSDRTLREFIGPTTLTVQQNVGQGGTVLANLTAAVVDMLFGPKPEASDAVMATRAIETAQAAAVSVPVLVRPAPGENLLEMPREFKWLGVQDIPLYRISVYSSTKMMWQATTSESYARWPAKDCDFRPGEVYHWVVEALVGNTTLRSRAGDFAILDREKGLELARALSEIDTTIGDPAAGLPLKARLCIDFGAFSRAMEVLDASIATSPTRTAHLLRAELDDTIGLSGDAVADYKRAMALPGDE